MSLSVELLRLLHRLHTQLADVRSRLERGPLQVQAVETTVRALSDELAAAKDEVKRARMAADQKDLQLREREDRIKSLRSKLNACTTNREYQTLLEQIAADEQANSVLTDEVLESLEKIESLKLQVPLAEEKLAKGRDDAARVTQRVAEERRGLEADQARLSEELRQAEGQLPGDFRADYDRAVRGRGDDGMAPLEGQACGGCYQTVTPNMLQMLNLSRPVFCKSCGRLLYLAE